MEPVDPMEVAAQLFPDMPPGFPYEGFETQELILPDGDDMGIRSDDDAINEDEIQTDTGFGACVGECSSGARIWTVCHLSAAVATAEAKPLPSKPRCKYQHACYAFAVITGLPVVPQDKYDKLLGVIKKIAENVEGLPSPPKPGRHSWKQAG